LQAAPSRGGGGALRAGPAGRDRTSPVGLRFFTTAYRQGIVFREMKRIARELLELWRR